MQYPGALATLLQYSTKKSVYDVEDKTVHTYLFSIVFVVFRSTRILFHLSLLSTRVRLKMIKTLFYSDLSNVFKSPFLKKTVFDHLRPFLPFIR